VPRGRLDFDLRTLACRRQHLIAFCSQLLHTVFAGQADVVAGQAQAAFILCRLRFRGGDGVPRFFHCAHRKGVALGQHPSQWPVHQSGVKQNGEQKEQDSRDGTEHKPAKLLKYIHWVFRFWRGVVRRPLAQSLNTLLYKLCGCGVKHRAMKRREKLAVFMRLS
jgi:hypothetical protein